jgi:hypothetical protein
MWVRRATRRRTLLGLGLSLTEQRDTPEQDIAELLAVHAVYVEVENEANEG